MGLVNVDFNNASVNEDHFDDDDPVMDRSNAKHAKKR